MKFNNFSEQKQFYETWSRKEEGNQKSWVDENSPHYWRYISYLELLNPIITPNKKILDIGCGQGNFLKLIEKGQKYGVDISSKYIELAKKNIPDGIFIENKSDKLPFEDNYFDIIICTEFLEHVMNPEGYVNEIHRVLKGDGVVLFSTYNHWNLSNIITLKTIRNIYCSNDHLREYNFFSFYMLLSKKFKIKKFQGSSSSKLTRQYFNIHKIDFVKKFLPILYFLTFLTQKTK